MWSTCVSSCAFREKEGGVALCLYTATVVSLANILQLRLMRGAGWGNDHLMMASGKHL